MKYLISIIFSFFFVASASAATLHDISDIVEIGESDIYIPQQFTQNEFLAPNVTNSYYSPNIISTGTNPLVWAEYKEDFKINDSSHGYSKPTDNWGFIKNYGSGTIFKPGYYSWGGDNTFGGLGCSNAHQPRLQYVAILQGLTANALPEDIYYFSYFVNTDCTLGDPSDYDYPLNDDFRDYWNLGTTTPNFQLSPIYYCTLGEDCSIDFIYNDLAVGKVLWAMPDPYLAEFKDFQNYHVASTTLSYKYPYNGTLYLPASFIDQYEASSTVLMSFFLQGTDQLRVAIRIQIVSIDFYGLDFLSEDPCVTVATSSGEFFDDFRYGLECGSRRLIYWMFRPSESAILRLSNSKEVLMQEFPFNVYADLNYILSTSTVSTSSIVTYGDLINDSGYDNANYEMANFDQVATIINDNFFTVTVYNTLTFLVYLIGFVYVVVRSHKIIHKDVI